MQLLIAHSVVGDHEGLHHGAFIALGFGRIKIRARGEMVDAVALDGDRFAVQVIDRDRGRRPVAEEAQRMLLPVRSGEYGKGEHAAQHHQADQEGEKPFHRSCTSYLKDIE